MTHFTGDIHSRCHNKSRSYDKELGKSVTKKTTPKSEYGHGPELAWSPHSMGEQPQIDLCSHLLPIHSGASLPCCGERSEFPPYEDLCSLHGGLHLWQKRERSLTVASLRPQTMGLPVTLPLGRWWHLPPPQLGSWAGGQASLHTEAECEGY